MIQVCTCRLAALIGVGLAVLVAPHANAQVTYDISYQGRLRNSGSPFFGTADFNVTLWSAPAGGTQLGPGCSFVGVAVDDGYFNLACDFGTDAFSTDEDRWMEIAVQAPSGVGGFTTLSPRQKIHSTPFALQSKSLEFPYSDDVDLPDDVLIDLHNTATTGITSAFVGRINSPDGAGVFGLAEGVSGAGRGVSGFSSTENGRGIEGQATSLTGSNFGVTGSSVSPDGTGVYGYVGSTTGTTVGLHGVAESSTGVGVLGEAFSFIGNAIGGKFYSDSSIGTGVWGEATDFFGPNVGVRGYTRSDSGTGVYGRAFNTLGSGTKAGRFENNTAASGYGVWGETTDSGFALTTGVYGRTRSRDSTATGVTGIADSSFGDPTGVYGESLGGIGVYGNHTGAGGTVGSQYGVLGESNGSQGGGVKGVGYTFGVEGVTAGAAGSAVRGIAPAVINDMSSRAGYFENAGNADQTVALEAFANSDTGLIHAFQATLHASNTNQGSTAGRFFGPVIIADDEIGRHALVVNGESALLGNVIVGGFGSPSANLDVSGNLTKGSGTFRIDHPLDPENKYLQHSFVESPDMMNIYNGNVTTDESGFADLTLPDWFEALNRDFRYQLTVIDTTDSADFVQAKVVREIENNTFAIRTNAPHARVSWQVTGVRHDPYAAANRIKVELNKPESERGALMHGDAYAQIRAATTVVGEE